VSSAHQSPDSRPITSPLDEIASQWPGHRAGGTSHTATARGPRACAVAVADKARTGLPMCAPCKRDRGGPARGVASQLAAHGAGGSPQHPGHHPQRVASPWSHGLPHSCVDRISWTWQHRSPFGREVLHLELELKEQRKRRCPKKQRLLVFTYGKKTSYWSGTISDTGTGPIQGFLPRASEG
jgi:hypothetical protein